MQGCSSQGYSSGHTRPTRLASLTRILLFTLHIPTYTTMFGLGALILAAAAAVAQSVDPLYKYDPNYGQSISQWGGAVAAVPLTDGWEHVIDGSPPNGSTWASQQPGTQTSFRDREGDTFARTALPGQAFSVVFVGRAMMLSGQVTGFTGFDFSNPQHWQVYIDGERALSTRYTTYNTTSPSQRILDIPSLPSNAFHNVTVVTGPEFTGVLTLSSSAWYTLLSREK